VGGRVQPLVRPTIEFNHSTHATSTDATRDSTLSLSSGAVLTPGITRRPEPLMCMRAGVSAVGCMPLLDAGLPPLGLQVSEPAFH
jgi:hypothetical protein